MSVRVIKADLNGDKRRFACDSTSFSKLTEQLGAAFAVPPAELICTYLDDENDKITIANDADLAMAWEVLQGKPLLKLELYHCAANVATSGVEQAIGADRAPPTQAPTPTAAVEAEAESQQHPGALLANIAENFLGGLTGAGGRGASPALSEAMREVPEAMRTLAPLLRSEMEKLPEKLEAMGATINALAEQAAAETARNADRARETAAETAAAAAETASQASAQAHVAAAAAMEQASAVTSAVADFLPPQYRQAVTKTLARASADMSQSDFLPPAYRAAVNAATGQASGPQTATAEDDTVADNTVHTAETAMQRAQQAKDRALRAQGITVQSVETSGPTEVERLHRALARRFGVEPAAISLESLTLDELQLVAEEAESLSQLQVIEAAMKARCHLGIWCDVTGAKPIRGTRYTKPIANDTYDLCEAAWRALSSEAERQTFTVLPRPDLRLLLRASRSIIDAPPAAEDQPDAALEAMEAEAEPATADLADEPPACVGQREHAHEHEHEHEQELLVSVSSELEETESAPTVDGTPVAAVVASPVSTAPATAPVENEDCSESDAVCRVPEAYRVQVGKLLEMGYGEDFTIDRLIELVAANNGDLRATIFALLEQ